MNSVSPLFPIIVYVIAFLSAYLVRFLFRPGLSHRRFETLDGFRGLLALAVFIHHAGIWQQYVVTGNWQTPPTRLLLYLGKVSVTFFFMITAFLFVNKLLEARQQGFHWRAFFVSRLFRLVPMYYLSLLILVLFIFKVLDWQLLVSLPELFTELMHWSLFTIYESAPINHYWVAPVNSGVEWTLPLEWFFYFSLPLLGLLILKKKPGWKTLLIALLFAASFFMFHRGDPYFLIAFIGGGLAPFFTRYGWLKRFARSRYASLCIVIAVCLMGRMESERDWPCMLLSTFVFHLVALGNSFFGLLKTSSLKLLGDISYSTYLLHGLFLFAVFNLTIGMPASGSLSETGYALVIFGATPVLVLISFLGFRYVELPFIHLAKRINSGP